MSCNIYSMSVTMGVIENTRRDVCKLEIELVVISR